MIVLVQRITRVFDNKFLKHMTVLASSSIAGQILVIGTQPLISRLYRPQDFGTFALFSSAFGVLAVIGTFRYEQAIVLPSEDDYETASALLRLSWGIGIFLGLFVLCLIWLGGGWFTQILHVPQLRPWLWLLPLSVVVTSISQSLLFFSLRTQAFKSMSMSTISKSAATVLIQTVGGLLGLRVLGLIAGQFIGQMSSAGTLLLKLKPNRLVKASAQTTFSRIIKVAKDYSKFPLYSAPQSLVSELSHTIPNFVLAYFFSLSAVGNYMLAYKLLQLPAYFIGESIRQVFYQQATLIHQTGGVMYPFLKKITVYLVVIGSIPFLTIGLFGHNLFLFIFGSQWTSAGIDAQILAVGLFASFFNAPSVMLINIYNVQHYHMMYEVCLFIARFSAIVIGGLMNNLYLSLWAYSAVGFVFNLTLIIFIFCYSKHLDFTPRPKEDPDNV